MASDAPIEPMAVMAVAASYSGVKRQEPIVHDIVWDRLPDGPTTMDVVISPLDAQGRVLVAFVDVGRYQCLRDELEQSQRELESAYEELKSAVEELERTDEELRTTNEELEITNEESHSTNVHLGTMNEELETMNGELQSTNEELETINNELRDRSTEVDVLKRFLQSILGSLQTAVVIFGPDMEVQAWNQEAEET
jgi:two-component system, chemotaxis family, CheB/CheR fusion protein